MEDSQMLSNQSALFNSTEMKRRVYLFTPAGFTTKLVLFSLLATIGIVGLLGNMLIYYFISTKKKTKSFMQTAPFVRNFNFYIKNLALSDILSNIISVPLICIQIMFDVFQHSWTCIIVRSLTILFPSITMNNLMVISLERYLATRAVPRSFSVSTVRKLIFTAWLIGSIFILGPTATFNGVRYDLNDTHYTVVCKYDNSYFTSKIIVLCYSILQHVIPGVILSYLNIAVAKTLWTRQKRRITVQHTNAIRANLIAAKLRGTYILIVLTFAFIIPYSVLPYYAAYIALAKPSIDFQTDFMTRYLSAALLYSNSTINFIIYLVQMKDFRAFLKKLFCGNGNTMNANPPGDGIQLPNNR
ncbi:allatostatin-A receptor-like [Orbicella faveolata]|uniref:allatostatin-A receptor-like n=1 Tax=Orbicella faveolata TaxID=48498 RepID=UPI0009E1BBBE|nr:allatostatin-A receptor-like [Orbicella faveolata]